jgi:hypothetical protein
VRVSCVCANCDAHQLLMTGLLDVPGQWRGD